MPRNCPPHVPDRCFANIDTDNYSSEILRDEVIVALTGAVDDSDARRRYEAWRRAAIAADRINTHPLNFERGERVGRLRYRGNYDSELADILRQDAQLGGADESDIEELVRWIFGEPCAIDPDTAASLFDMILADRMVEANQGWYFRTLQRSATPLGHGDASCLPWRLGLRDVRTGSKYVAFDIDPSSLGNPRFPTFVDVSWECHERWRPNGTTQPLPDTPPDCDNVGLEEFVAIPPTFRAVVIPIDSICAR